MPLDFRGRVDAARSDADADDMAEGMAGPEPTEAAPPDPMLCCPECGTEFPLSEGIPEAGAESPAGDEAMEGDYEGFTLGSRS